MIQSKRDRDPVVLAVGGHDPTGGAGIQADCEAIASQACWPISLLTALTVQSTTAFLRWEAVRPDSLLEQADALLGDVTVAAIKIGLVPTPEIAVAVQAILQGCQGVPVVLDPVLAAGTGTDWTDRPLIEAYRTRLIPAATVVTPNAPEARRLAGVENLDVAARALTALGSAYALVTGTHENTERVTNRLYGTNGLIESLEWERLPAIYHGSGCTLASALAALLARGVSVVDASREAQRYTWNALSQGARLGQGHYHPNRLYWLAPRAT